MNPDQQTHVPFQVSQGCLIANIQIDLNESVLQVFQHDLLNKVESHLVRGVILDLSGIDLLDSVSAEMLVKTISMVQLMGARAVVSGLRPGVVASLIDMDVDLEKLEGYLNLDDALLSFQEDDAIEEKTEDEDEELGADHEISERDIEDRASADPTSDRH